MQRDGAGDRRTLPAAIEERALLAVAGFATVRARRHEWREAAVRAGGLSRFEVLRFASIRSFSFCRRRRWSSGK